MKQAFALRQAASLFRSPHRHSHAIDIVHATEAVVQLRRHPCGTEAEGLGDCDDSCDLDHTPPHALPPSCRYRKSSTAGLGNSITGIAGCCVLAASGHDTVPAISLMKSRGRMPSQSPVVY